MMRILFDYKYNKYLGSLEFAFGKHKQWNNESIVRVHESKLRKWFESSCDVPCKRRRFG